MRQTEGGDAAPLPGRGGGDRDRSGPVVPVEDLHPVTLAGEGEGSGDDDAHDSS